MGNVKKGKEREGKERERKGKKGEKGNVRESKKGEWKMEKIVNVRENEKRLSRKI